MSSTETLSNIEYWLALTYAPGIGAKSFMALHERFTDISELFSSQPEGLKVSAALTAYLKQPNWAAVKRDLAWASQPQRAIITFNDDKYPALLREINGAPPILYAWGDLDLLTKPQLAVIGSRNPTALGAETAQQFAYYLANAGYVITSGLALGIDAAAHQGALAATGATIGVLGSGLAKIYPAQHQQLAEQIAQQGLLLSEFPPHTAPKASHFPQRNRIISGLSMGTLVIEASLNSGSLITAGYALEQGREVFAIPGSIHNPLAKGCHALIRQGAKLVETADDIVEELNGMQAWFKQPEKKQNLSAKNFTIETPPSTLQAADTLTDLAADYQKLLSYLSFEAIPIDNIIQRSGLTAESVSSMLLLLELQGYVNSSSGGYSRTRQVKNYA